MDDRLSRPGEMNPAADPPAPQGPTPNARMEKPSGAGKGRELSFTIAPRDQGRRLDVVLLRLLGEEFSRAQVQRLLRQGLVTLEGAPARPSQKARAGQSLRVTIPPPRPVELVPTPMNLQILYEDADLLVVNKPPGLVVHPSPGHASHTLVHGLLHHCGHLAAVGGKLRPGIVHRLDKDTSGALVAAKSDQAHRRLVTAFAAGHLEKQYLALVWGQPPCKGEIAAGIGRHPVDRKRMSTRGRHTKPARTQWRVLKRYPQGLSLLLVRIHTGRTHQIRVHLSEAGHPVVGDATYGGTRGLHGQGKRALEPGPVRDAVVAAGRQMLHALYLGLDHPLGRGRLEITAPLPPDFRRVLFALWEQNRHA